MSEALNLANRFREPLLNGKWVANTNLKEQLSHVSYQQANKQVNDLNSIAALTFHIDYYIVGVLQVLNGGPLDIRDKYSFDMPEIQSEKDWIELQERLWTHTEAFAQKIESLSDEKLDSVFVDEKYGDYRRNIEGLIEHAYYHLGQVVLIKKLLTKNA